MSRSLSFRAALLLTATLGGGALASACASDGDVIDPIDEGDGGTRRDSGAVDPWPDAARPDGGTPTTSRCGDGKTDPGEECDDGNNASNDGCSAQCKLESAFEGDTCPGKTLTLTQIGASYRGSVVGSTVGAFNQYGSACGGGSGADVVYTFTPPSSGKAIITLTADFSAIVSARSSCATAASEMKCGDVGKAEGGQVTIEVPVFVGQPTSVVIDGFAGSSGGFTLDVDVSLAVCGNGVAELPETCDDGNTVSGDGCSAGCTLEEGGVLNACPGQPFKLTGAPGVPRKISFAGDTSKQGARTTGATGCYFFNGSNVVYAIKSDVDGAAKAELTSGYTRSNIHVRSDCGSNLFQLGCMAREEPGGIDVAFPVKKDHWFYVFVDGDGTSSRDYAGPYSVDVTVTPGACGNDVLDGNEECDDGNAVTGDGCDASCKLEPAPAAGACPGQIVTLAPQADGSRTAVVSGDTSRHGDSVRPCDVEITGNSPRDAVYTVTPDIDGYLDVLLDGPFTTVASVLSSCAAPVGSQASVLACSWKGAVSTDFQTFVLDGMGSAPKRVGVPVVAGTTYHVVASSWNQNGTPSAGPFELRLKVSPAACGNGVVEGTEACDDGGTDPGDGCDATCQLEPITSRSTCGDAEVLTLTEGAPGSFTGSFARGTTNLLANGNFFTSATDDDKPCWAPGRNAFFSITAPVAGVLRATARSAAFDVVLGLRQPCVLTGPALACANAVGKADSETLAKPVAAGETVWIVVDGKSASERGRFDLDVSVTPSGCGDGFFVPSATEQCDDGNNVSGDGCSATCMLEPLAGVDVCPGVPLTLAGTGIQPRTGSITFGTSSLNADYVGACGGSSKEGVVRVVAPTNGVLRATVRGMPNATVYARTVCNDPSTELLKTSGSTCPSVVHDVVTFQVTSGSQYFLFVDGLDGAVGVPTLDVVVTP